MSGTQRKPEFSETDTADTSRYEPPPRPLSGIERLAAMHAQEEAQKPDGERSWPEAVNS